MRPLFLINWIKLFSSERIAASKYVNHSKGEMDIQDLEAEFERAWDSEKETNIAIKELLEIPVLAALEAEGNVYTLRLELLKEQFRLNWLLDKIDAGGGLRTELIASNQLTPTKSSPTSCKEEGDQSESLEAKELAQSTTMHRLVFFFFLLVDHG